MKNCFFYFLLCVTAASVSSKNGSAGPPIVLVPGDGGSQFEAKLNKPRVVHIWCDRKTTTWFSLWLNLELLAPYILDCLIDNMKLIYDNKTHTTSNNLGVELRQPGFGNTSTVEYLDSSQLSATSYFYHIVEALVSWGYTRNVNIRGAPYDFRKAPNEMSDFITNLTALVEQTYLRNGRRRVVLIGHSMGNLYMLWLMNRQTKAWKDKYIHSMVTLAAPWGGAVKTLRLFASGDNLGIFVVNALSARPEQRSMPSSAWLLPYDTFWRANETLVYAPHANYTVNDYARFFRDIRWPAGMQMRDDTKKYLQELRAPGVPVHCVHGTGVETPAALKYSPKQWYDSQPDVVWGDGDGTVNLRSLMGCDRWKGKQKQPVVRRNVTNADHIGILDNAEVIAYLKSVLYGQQ